MQHNKTAQLAAIVFGIVFFSVIVTLIMMYNTAIDGERERLANIVQSKATLIEAIYRYNVKHIAEHHEHPHVKNHHNQKIFAETMALIRDAQRLSSGFGRTGKFNIASFENGQITYLLTHHCGPHNKNNAALPFSGPPRYPMERAVSGESGAMIGEDHCGTAVVAAYEPLRTIGAMGIVAKINLAEIRAPFIQAGLIVLGIAVLLAMAGSQLIFHITVPMAQELQQMSRRYRMAASASKSAAWELLLDKGEIICDDTLKQLMGYEPEELGKKLEQWLALFHPDDQEKTRTILKAINDGDMSQYAFEVRFMQKDGSFRWYYLSGRRFDMQDDVPHIFGATVDITAIKESLQQLEALFETMAEGVVFHDAKGRIIAYNQAALNLLGITSEQIQNRTSMDPRWKAVHEDGSPFPGEEHPAMIALQRGKKITNVIMGVDSPACNSRVWILINATPLFFDSEGKAQQVYATFLDITERIKAEMKIREEKQHFQTLFEHVQNGVLIVSTDGIIRFANQNAHRLFERHKLKGEPLGIPVVNTRNETAPVELLTPGLKVKFVMAGSVPSIWNSMPVYQITLHDVTELHRQEEMILAQSRQAAMGDMIAMIAHQWRQPLTIIGMTANNLKMSLTLDETIGADELENIADTINNHVQHLSRTIDDFRNFFKPNQQKLQTTVGEVLGGALNIVGNSLKNNNIEIELQDHSDCQLLTYPNQLLQVFLNLIGNAKDILQSKTVKSAKITITIDETPSSVVTTVCDNGGGIPGTIINRIGEPYFTTKESNGTGLGIYISATIVKKHLNGTLTWENRSGNACFIITLPKE